VLHCSDISNCANKHRVGGMINELEVTEVESQNLRGGSEEKYGKPQRR
jgi:hypothetical protein